MWTFTGGGGVLERPRARRAIKMFDRSTEFIEVKMGTV